MIYEHIKTDGIHINTIIKNNEISFQNLTRNAYCMQYRIKLKTTSVVKLVDIFENTKYFGEEDMNQSIIVDWGDNTSTKVFTENINTGLYNPTSTAIIKHTYDLPMNEEIEITIMTEKETMCPISFDDSLDGIEFVSFGGVFCPFSKNIGSPIHSTIRRSLTEVYSMKDLLDNETLFSKFSGTMLNNIFFNCPQLTKVAGDIFEFGCANVVSAVETFRDCPKLLQVESTLFNSMIKLENTTACFKGCTSLTAISNILSNNSLVSIIDEMFMGCRGITEFDPANLSNLNIHSMTGAFLFNRLNINILDDKMVGTTIEDTPNSIRGAFSHIEGLLIDSNKFLPFKLFKNKDSLFSNSAIDRDMNNDDLRGCEVNNGKNMFSRDEMPTTKTYPKITDNFIKLVQNGSSIINISNILQNRCIEASRNIFDLSDTGAVEVNYTNSLKGSKSLYSDKQIFKDKYSPSMSSGVEQIEATIEYQVTTKIANAVLQFVSPYNKYNPNFAVEDSGKIKITCGSQTIEINEARLNELKTSDGFITMTIPTAGNYTVRVKYSHCAPFTLTYKNISDQDKYDITRATIELFPTDVSYIGLYGLELWTATNIDGDLFKLFYDRPNLPEVQSYIDSNLWINGLFKYMNNRVTSISETILSSISFVGTITAIENLFRSRTDIADRDIVCRDYFKTVNELSVINGNHFQYTREVTMLRDWSSDCSSLEIVDLTTTNIKNILINFPKLNKIERWLTGYSVDTRNDLNKLDLSNSGELQILFTLYGMNKTVDWDIINLPKIREIHLLHEYTIPSGLSLNETTGKFIDFSGVEGNIDITMMFCNENIEIPDNFIRNVTGSIRVTSAFKECYSLSSTDENVIYQNVTAREGDSQITMMGISDGLVLEVGRYDSSLSPQLGVINRDTTNGPCLIRLKNTNGSIVGTVFTNNFTRDVIPAPRCPITRNADQYTMEIFSKYVNLRPTPVDATPKLNILSMSGCFGYSKWPGELKLKDMFTNLKPENITCEDAGGPWRNITPTDGIINLSHIFQDTEESHSNIIDYRIFKTKAQASDTIILESAFENCNIADINVNIFNLTPSINANGMFNNSRNRNLNFVVPADEPYLFMEFLFTKIVNADNMFFWASQPRNLFNGAPFFGCNRTGGIIPIAQQKLKTLERFLSKHSRPENAVQTNVLSDDFLPVWNPACQLNLDVIHDFIIGSNYKLNPAADYTKLVNNSNAIRTWSWLSNMPFEHTIEIDKINIFNSIDVGTSFNSGGFKYKLNRDYSWLTSNVSREGAISLLQLFNDTGSLNESDPNFYFLIEPIDGTFSNKDVSLSIDSRGCFTCFKTYAPDNILFRNARSIVGSSKATKLEYPEFIEYQGITVSGNVLTFEREDMENRFSTYLTVSINYGSGYETAIWNIVDRTENMSTIALDQSKIVDNKVSVKIQSTECFYLTESNVSSVDKLDGKFKKLEPRASEYFNWNRNHVWFIKSFGDNVFQYVKIKDGTIRFTKSDSSGCLLEHITASAFRNQGHIRNINHIFYGCSRFDPPNDILTNFRNVTTASHAFSKSGCTNTTGKLSPLVKATNLSWAFSESAVKVIAVDTFKLNVCATLLDHAFTYCTLQDSTFIPKEFFLNIPPSVVDISSMFSHVTGLNKTIEGTSIEDGSFILNETRDMSSLFEGSDLVEALISYSVDGSNLLPMYGRNMFKGISTYDDRTLFEERYGIATGAVFKSTTPLTFISTVEMNNLKFDTIECVESQGLVKLRLNDANVSQRNTYYLTYKDLKERGINASINKVSLFGDCAVLPICDKVTEIRGQIPGTSIIVNEFTKIGKRFPNLTYIDPNLLCGLTEQTSFESLFEEIRDINIVPKNIFRHNTKVTNMNYVFRNAKGTLNTMVDTYFKIQTKLASLVSAFEGVKIKLCPSDSLKLSSSSEVNIHSIYKNTGAYISKNAIVSTSNLQLEDALKGCKSIYEAESEIVTAPTKTGNTNYTLLESFKPVLNVTANEPINLFPMHNSITAGDKMDIIVDWGDNAVETTLLALSATSVASIEHIPTSTGVIRPRVWSNTYAVGIKKKTDVNCLIATGEVRGSVGKLINPIRDFIKTYIPLITSITSDFLIRTALPTTDSLFNESIIAELPPSLFRRSIHDPQPNITTLCGAFRGMNGLVTVSPDVLKDFNNGVSVNNTPVNINGLFLICPLLTSVPDTLFTDMLSYGYKLKNAWRNMFSGCHSLNTIPSFMKINYIENIVNPNLYGCLYDTHIGTIPSGLFPDFRNITNMAAGLGFIKDVAINTDNIINKEWFHPTQTVDMSNLLVDKYHTDPVLNNILMEYKEGLSLNVTNALKGWTSIYFEEEVFSGNTLVGDSGLITLSRESMTITATAGDLVLKPATTAGNGTIKAIFKKNGEKILVDVYTINEPVRITCVDDDVIEIIVVGDHANTYYMKDPSSVSKIKKIGGVWNTVTNEETGECYNHMIDIFGSDVEEIGATFFNKMGNALSVEGLCKGLHKLKKLDPAILNPFINVTNWSSMFENCSALTLLPTNSNMFRLANKGVQFDYMFKNCSSITLVPTEFFKGCTAMDKTFIGTFMNTGINTELPVDIDDF